jgi:mono/diheme cytochrome c family protein
MHRLALAALALVPLLSAAGPDDRPVSPLTLADTAGTAHRLPADGAKATVLLFAGLDCPRSQRDLARLAEAAGRYRDKGVSFLAVFPNEPDRPDAIRRRAAGVVPCLPDPDQRAADRFRVTATPTAVLLDAAGRVCYRGSLDDGRDKEPRRYLQDALDAVLADRPVAVAETEAVGCLIERKLPAAKGEAITYSGQVGAILHRNCAACHRPGQPAPFHLLTYEQARSHARNIKAVVTDRRMPPWKPANHGTFRDERWLADADIDLLAKWVDAGAPLGDPAKVPPPPTFADGWQLGTPDLVLQAPEYEVGAEGSDEYRCFVLDPKLTEDRHVRAVEFRPGNGRVVHHVMTYIDTSGVSTWRQAVSRKPGYSTDGTGPGIKPAGDLGGWGPGDQPFALPDGTARLLPAGSMIVLEVHYHKDGKPEKDRTTLALHFAKAPVTRTVQSKVVLNTRFVIPAGAGRHEVQARWNVPEDLHVLSIQPHMHLIGREMQITATLPDGTERVLIHLKDWDFNWQLGYPFAEPLALPAGTVVRLRSWFDNSEGNAANPNRPPKDVRFGLQTTDEMCVAYLLYTRDRQP